MQLISVIVRLSYHYHPLITSIFINRYRTLSCLSVPADNDNSNSMIYNSHLRVSRTIHDRNLRRCYQSLIIDGLPISENWAPDPDTINPSLQPSIFLGCLESEL